MNHGIGQQINAPSADLFDVNRVEQMFREEIQWPNGARPHNIMLERCWPARDSRFIFEWSFELDDRRRHALFGITSSCATEPSEAPSHRRAERTAFGVSGVQIAVPPLAVSIHSPENDPEMPHLRRCLDGKFMATELCRLGTRIDVHEMVHAGKVDCRLMGYRPQRRAAIVYRFLEPDDSRWTNAAETRESISSTSDIGSRLEALPTHEKTQRCVLVGKTYHRKQMDRLIRLHTELNEQLAWHTNRRVRVPTVIGHLPDLHMVLFSHAGGHCLGHAGGWTYEELKTVAKALSSLHHCSLEELDVFSLADECRIIRRWSEVLDRTSPAAAEATKRIVETLLRHSLQIDMTCPCTVHRDFYESQLRLNRRTTTILDLDTLAISNPCVDLGNLLAHMYLAGLVRGADLRDIDGLATVFIRRYESDSKPVDRRALSFYFASALFRVGAVHALRNRTRRFSPVLWSFAADVLRRIDLKSNKRLPRFLRDDRIEVGLALTRQPHNLSAEFSS